MAQKAEFGLTELKVGLCSAENRSTPSVWWSPSGEPEMPSLARVLPSSLHILFSSVIRCIIVTFIWKRSLRLVRHSSIGQAKKLQLRVFGVECLESDVNGAAEEILQRYGIRLKEGDTLLMQPVCFPIVRQRLH